MNFIEATSSGKQFRRKGDNQSYFGFDEGHGLREYFYDSRKSSYPSFQMQDFLIGEFEFIEPEPMIEKGDVVTKEGCESSRPERGCVVLVVDSGHTPLFCEENACACEVGLANLTLIRKGPKTITFERVALVDMAIEGGTVGIGITAYHNTVHGKMITEIQESDKAYKVTFEEEK